MPDRTIYNLDSLLKRGPCMHLVSTVAACTTCGPAVAFARDTLRTLLDDGMPFAEAVAVTENQTDAEFGVTLDMVLAPFKEQLVR